MIGQKDGTYNRMTKFRIGEVSSVDRPAQGPGARCEIMKRAEPLSKLEQLPASSEQSGPNAGSNPTEDNTMNEEQFNEKIAEITKQLEDSNLRAERAERLDHLHRCKRAAQCD